MMTDYNEMADDLVETTFDRLDRKIARLTVDKERLRKMLQNRNVSDDTIEAWLYDDERPARIQKLLDMWNR